jgi:hypothetical protein
VEAYRMKNFICRFSQLRFPSITLLELLACTVANAADAVRAIDTNLVRSRKGL